MYLRFARNITRCCRFSQCKPSKTLLSGSRFTGTELRLNYGFHSSNLTMQDIKNNPRDNKGKGDAVDTRSEQSKSKEWGRKKERKRVVQKRQLIGIGINAVAMMAYAYYLYRRREDDMENRFVEKGEYGGKVTETAGTGRPDIGGPFELLDHHGNTVTNETFYGKWVLINFGYCRCPDICPDQLDRMGLLIDELDASGDGDDLQTLFVSIDPRDDVDTMRDFICEFHPKMLGLTGSVEQQTTAAKNFRIYFSQGPEDKDGDYVMDHSIVFYLMDPEGIYASYFMGMDRESVPEMADKIRKLMSGELEPES